MESDVYLPTGEAVLASTRDAVNRYENTPVNTGAED
jgi:hypothetical protein